MATKHYLAIADRAPGESNWSIIFPDFPGVTSVATRWADVMDQARDALATAVEDTQRDGEALPEPSAAIVPSDHQRFGLHDPQTVLVPLASMSQAIEMSDLRRADVL